MIAKYFIRFLYVSIVMGFGVLLTKLNISFDDKEFWIMALSVLNVYLCGYYAGSDED